MPPEAPHLRLHVPITPLATEISTRNTVRPFTGGLLPSELINTNANIFPGDCPELSPWKVDLHKTAPLYFFAFQRLISQLQLYTRSWEPRTPLLFGVQWAQQAVYCLHFPGLAGDRGGRRGPSVAGISHLRKIKSRCRRWSPRTASTGNVTSRPSSPNAEGLRQSTDATGPMRTLARPEGLRRRSP